MSMTETKATLGPEDSKCFLCIAATNLFLCCDRKAWLTVVVDDAIDASSRVVLLFGLWTSRTWETDMYQVQRWL